MNNNEKEIWFVTGSQHLYGAEALRQVEENSRAIVVSLSTAKQISVNVVFKAVVTTQEEIKQVCLEANSAPNCIGLITWMHTFSPARIWIAGLKVLDKPMLHLHTQFNRDIPWNNIDMEFMNLNQSAHGDREFGFIGARMHVNRKIVVGYWKDADVLEELGTWARVALAWDDAQNLKIARFGDNMRDVAVTEGNKVSAQIKFGFSVNGYGLGELNDVINQVADKEIDQLVDVYFSQYEVQKELLPGGLKNDALRESARIELGLRAFLDEGGFKAFTTTFENLYGLKQLPGLAVQRLMADGYGFGAEGDWKTAALVRAMKVMASGLKGGVSFMEDYTYHLEPHNMKVLGAHMLEVCPSISSAQPSIEIHPLAIGNRADPVRLVFNVSPGPAVVASLIDLGDRFRMIVNKINVVNPETSLPKLPVARVLWEPLPNLKVGANSWILAGGAHHTSFSNVLSEAYLETFAEMADVEYLLIDENTDLPTFKKELRWNDLYYRLENNRSLS